LHKKVRTSASEKSLTSDCARLLCTAPYQNYVSILAKNVNLIEKKKCYKRVTLVETTLVCLVFIDRGLIF